MRISDDYRDALVDLAFRYFPAMDSDDIARVIQAVLKLTAVELHEAVTCERRRLLAWAARGSRN